MEVAWGHGPIVVTGILRPHYSERSLRGWALVPPIEFGGSENFRSTPLQLDVTPVRRVLCDELTGDVRLRYWNTPEVMFEIARLPDVMSAEPRNVRPGRYLTEGGRRSRDPWAS